MLKATRLKERPLSELLVKLVFFFFFTMGHFLPLKEQQENLGFKEIFRSHVLCFATQLVSK